MESLPCFGVIVPGQPPRYDFCQVGVVQWTLTFDGCPGVFLVFLTMHEPLPVGYGLSIYASSHPQSSGEGGGYFFLGAVTAGRPSSLFEVPAALLPPMDVGPSNLSCPVPCPTAVTLTVGVALETDEEINNKLGGGGAGAAAAAAAGATWMMNPSSSSGQQGASVGIYKSNTATKFAFAEKVLHDFYVFVMSFAKTISAATLPEVLSGILNSSSHGATEYVVLPMSFVDDWRRRTERRMKANGGAV